MPIGQHTCSSDGGYKFVLENAPFLSQWKVSEFDERQPYLGEGYYFWEYNMKQAIKWGDTWYYKGYFILEAQINTTPDNFLDLGGDVQKTGHFALMRRKLIASKDIQETDTLGEVIEYLKKASLIKPDIFPYKIIKAQDYKFLNNRQRFLFRRKSQSFTYLEQTNIFCLLEKTEVILSNKRIAYKFPP